MEAKRGDSGTRAPGRQQRVAGRVVVHIVSITDHIEQRLLIMH